MKLSWIKFLRKFLPLFILFSVAFGGYCYGNNMHAGFSAAFVAATTTSILWVKMDSIFSDFFDD